MRIGLISDTHVPTTMEYPPEQILKAFDSVDLILHAGNIHVTLVLYWLEQVAPVKASGSTDSDHPERHQSFSMECAEDSRVAPLQILELEGYRIGVANNLLLHGMTSVNVVSGDDIRFLWGSLGYCCIRTHYICYGRGTSGYVVC